MRHTYPVKPMATPLAAPGLGHDLDLTGFSNCKSSVPITHQRDTAANGMGTVSSFARLTFPQRGQAREVRVTKEHSRCYESDGRVLQMSQRSREGALRATQEVN